MNSIGIIFCNIKFKIIKIYNTLKCKFNGHNLDNETLPDKVRKLIFCTRRGCKFSFIEE